jgi:hypothetical protein
LAFLWLVKTPGGSVDIQAATRSFALISLLAALAVGGYLYVRSAEEATGPSGAVVQDAAAEAAADASLLVARTGLESFLAANGTYAGATVPTGVTLVGASDVSYCLQIGSGASIRHLTSPGPGTAEPGPC